MFSLLVPRLQKLLLYSNYTLKTKTKPNNLKYSRWKDHLLFLMYSTKNEKQHDLHPNVCLEMRFWAAKSN